MSPDTKKTEQMPRTGLGASRTATQDEKLTGKRYLIARGWYEASGRSAWRWWKPPFGGAFYRFRDALALERARSR